MKLYYPQDFGLKGMTTKKPEEKREKQLSIFENQKLKKVTSVLLVDLDIVEEAVRTKEGFR